MTIDPKLASSVAWGPRRKKKETIMELKKHERCGSVGKSSARFRERGNRASCHGLYEAHHNALANY